MQTLEQEVNQPIHYKSHISGIETIEITRYLDCDNANAWKYSMRYMNKHTPKKDLLKAVWYLNDFVKYFTNGSGDVSIDMHIPAQVVDKMIEVATKEPIKCMQDIFNDIISMTVAREIDLVKLNEHVIALKAYADTFKE